MDDHYAVLGVTRTATRDEIHEAYRRACIQLHPDKHTAANAEAAAAAFARAARAHAVLADSRLRAVYDSSGEEGVRAAQQLAFYEGDALVTAVRDALAARESANRGAWTLQREGLRVDLDVCSSLLPRVRAAAFSAAAGGRVFPLPSVSTGVLPAPWSTELTMRTQVALAAAGRNAGSATASVLLQWKALRAALSTTGNAHTVSMGADIPLGEKAVLTLDTVLPLAQPAVQGTASVSTSVRGVDVCVGLSSVFARNVLVLAPLATLGARHGPLSAELAIGTDAPLVSAELAVADTLGAVLRLGSTLAAGLKVSTRQASSVAVLVETGPSYGTGIRVEASSGRRTLAVPLRLAEDCSLVDIVASAGIAVGACLALAIAADALEERWAAFKETIAFDEDTATRRILEAQAENAVLNDSAALQHAAEHERATGGLVIEHGVLSGPHGVIDVRHALQRLVRDTALVVAPRDRRFDPAGVIGFADVGRPAILAVSYTFRGKRHATRISVGAPHGLVLPQRTHIVAH